MKKQIFFTLLIIFCLQISFAQTAQKSLKAIKIENKIYIDYDKASIFYGKDSTIINQKIEKEEAFASTNKSLSVFIKNHNPITNILSINNKAFENTNNTSYRNSIKDLLETFTFLKSDDQKLEKEKFNLIEKIDSISATISLDKITFNKTVNNIVKNINLTNISNRKKQLDSIKLKLNLINVHIRNKEKKVNSNISIETLENYKKQSEIIKKLNTYYNQLIDWDSKLTNGFFTEYRIHKISKDSIKALEITITQKKLKLDRGNINLEKSNDKNLSAQLNFEKFSRFIPEVAAAVVFSNLSFPKFGTETNENEEQVVSRTEDETFNKINVGLMINFNYNIGDDELVPFFQIGAGPSKKYPILFAGGGIRISEKFRISGGGAWTWINELSTLNIGDIVSGTSQIDNDQEFKFNATPKFYLSIQYKL